MAVVLLVLALIPTATILAAAVIRAWEPRSSWGARRERGSWILGPDSPLHRRKRPPDER